jgi:hypothetical protein
MSNADDGSPASYSLPAVALCPADGRGGFTAPAVTRTRADTISRQQHRRDPATRSRHACHHCSRKAWSTTLA